MLNTERKPITGKRVQLMATCLCDAFYDDVAAATVQVLEYLGVEVVFPEGQTCCGQPAFNGGDWTASRKVVRHTVKTFAGEEPVVVPSGSCAARRRWPFTARVTRAGRTAVRRRQRYSVRSPV